MTWLVELPNGDVAECETWDALQMAVETLVNDACRELRENLVVKRNGEYDAQATAVLSQPGLVV